MIPSGWPGGNGSDCDCAGPAADAWLGVAAARGGFGWVCPRPGR